MMTTNPKQSDPFMRRPLILAISLPLLMLTAYLIWQFVFHTHYHMEGVIVDELGTPLDGVSVHIDQSRFNSSKWPNGADYTYNVIEADRSFSVDVNLGLLEGASLSFYKKDYDSVRNIIPDKSRTVGMRIVLRRQLQWDPPGTDKTTGPLDQRHWPESIPPNARVIATSSPLQVTVTPVDGTYVLLSRTGEIVYVIRAYAGSEKIGFRIDHNQELRSFHPGLDFPLDLSKGSYEWRLYSTATRLPSTSTKPAAKPRP